MTILTSREKSRRSWGEPWPLKYISSTVELGPIMICAGSTCVTARPSGEGDGDGDGEENAEDDVESDAEMRAAHSS